MRKTFLLLLILIGVGAFGQEMMAGKGKLIHYKDFKSEYIGARNIEVWLPPDYSEKEKYSVLYMHNAQTLFDSTASGNYKEWKVDETADKVLSEGKTRKFIIVAISGMKDMRYSDFIPQKPFSGLNKSQQDSIYNYTENGATVFQSKLNSDNYLKFIVTELKPAIDKYYSVKTDPANTFIAGSGPAALFSLYAVCEFPEVFGGAACISTTWAGIHADQGNPFPVAMLNYIKQHLPSAKTHKFYFDYGTEGLEKIIKPMQQKADKIAKARGYSAKNWISKEFKGAGYSAESWSQRFQFPLLFLMSR